jgi:hypothetical protein
MTRIATHVDTRNTFTIQCDSVFYQCHSILRCLTSVRCGRTDWTFTMVKSSLEYYGYSREAITLQLCDDGALRNYGG